MWVLKGGVQASRPHAWLCWQNSGLMGNWRKGPFRAIFSVVTCIFLLGSVAPKVIKGVGDLVGKVGPSSPYVTM